MKRLPPIILFIFILLHPLQGFSRDNPFISKEAPKEGVKLPALASLVFSKIAEWQRRLNAELTRLVKQLKTDRSWQALWPLMLVSFLYGVVHAAGPGHGKVVVFSYFISQRSKIRTGMLLGHLISLFHAVSGVAIVLTLYFIIKAAYLSSFEELSQKIKLVSYGLIVVIGLVLLLESIFSLKKRPSRAPEGDTTVKASDRRGIIPLALAVGMVPCPGVVIIMLFALSFNLLFTGLMMSFIMALGMAATISVAGLLSILGQEGFLKGFSRKERTQNLIQKGLTIFGSLLLIGFGGILLAGNL